MIDAVTHYFKARKLRRQLKLAGWKIREIEFKNGNFTITSP